MALKCVLLNVSVRKAIILSNTDCYKCSNTLHTALYHFVYKVVLCVYLFEIDNWPSSYITTKKIARGISWNQTTNVTTVTTATTI